MRLICRGCRGLAGRRSFSCGECRAYRSAGIHPVHTSDYKQFFIGGHQRQQAVGFVVNFRRVFRLCGHRHECGGCHAKRCKRVLHADNLIMVILNYKFGYEVKEYYGFTLYL